MYATTTISAFFTLLATAGTALAAPAASIPDTPAVVARHDSGVWQIKAWQKKCDVHECHISFHLDTGDHNVQCAFKAPKDQFHAKCSRDHPEIVIGSSRGDGFTAMGVTKGTTTVYPAYADNEATEHPNNGPKIDWVCYLNEGGRCVNRKNM